MFLDPESCPELVAPFRDSKTRRGVFPGPQGEDSFLCEGRIIVEGAIAAHRQGLIRLQVILGDPAALARLDPPPGVPLVAASGDWVSELVGFPFHRGLMATAAVPPSPPMSQLWACRRLLVLPELVDITNLGLLLRSAATLGVDGVLYGKGPHVFDQRSVRVSMGTCWAIPVWRAESPLPILRQWQDQVPGSSIAAAALRPDSVSSRDWRPAERCALVLGQEGPGLSDEWLAACDTTVKIPMARGLDSLNVAAAGAILMHALVDA